MNFTFFSGEDKRLKIQLKKEVCGEMQPYNIPVGAVVTFTLPASPNDLEVQGVISNHDLGKVYVDLDDTQTTLMVSGDLIVKIVIGSTTRYAKKGNIISKLRF